MTVYKVRIIYKSGAMMDFNVTSFKISGDKYTWTHHSGPKPIVLGVDDISAVYQLEEFQE